MNQEKAAIRNQSRDSRAGGWASLQPRSQQGLRLRGRRDGGDQMETERLRRAVFFDDRAR